MSSKLNHEPRKLVLNKTSGEAIVGQDDTNIRPEFGNTGVNKIILHPMRKGIISFIAKILILFFLLKGLLKMYNICKLTSGIVLVHRILDVSKIVALEAFVALEVLLIFGAIHFFSRFFIRHVMTGILIRFGIAVCPNERLSCPTWMEKVRNNPTQGPLPLVVGEA